jgi:hypothetical protein
MCRIGSVADLDRNGASEKPSSPVNPSLLVCVVVIVVVVVVRILISISIVIIISLSLFFS